MVHISDTRGYNRYMAEIPQPKKTCCRSPDTFSKQILMRMNVTTGNGRLMT